MFQGYPNQWWRDLQISSKLHLVDLEEKGEEAMAASDMGGTENQSFVLHWKKNRFPNPNHLLHVGLNK